jgi:SAM-dependent methyltransferase
VECVGYDGRGTIGFGIAVWREGGGEVDEFKQMQRAMWGAGDYAELSQHIADVGERVVRRAGVDSGMSVLDVACGTGNAALPAARAGASVTGLDLVPELLAAGREKAAATGLEIEWVEGDAEQLPFEDGRFDRVFSTFGHMFAPRHGRVADEMARVCREGGVIATCTWTSEGTVGDVFRASATYLPPPPDYASPPILWGAEEHVREMFGDAATDFEFERHVSMIEWDSTEGFADYFMDRFGPFVTARNMLGERFGEMRQEIVAVWNRANEADDGSLRLPQEYLLSVVRL